MSENGCQAYYEDTLVLTLPSIAYPDSLVVCSGDSFIFLNPGADTSHQYLWSPANLVNDAQSPNPYVLQAIDQTFQVTVTSSTAFDTCQFFANVEMNIAPTITIDLPNDTLTCEDTICLDANVVGANDISWSLYPDFNALLSTQSSICVPVATFLKLYVKAENEWGCSLIDSVIVIKDQTNPIASFSFQTLGCGSAQTFQFVDPI